jgi:site-specific DNA-cytosine methylase
MTSAYSIREDAQANTFSATELEVATALKALQPSVQSHHAQTFVALSPPTIVHGTQDPCVSDIAFAQGTNNGGENVLIQSMAVRRLTPIECERLQGFPDGYTNIPWNKKPESPDGPRYKALGNSMAVPVMAWIGKRINQYEQQINSSSS